MKAENIVPDLDSVASIGAALIPHNEVRVLGDVISDLTLSLVSPLSTNDSDARQMLTSSAKSLSA
jgi:hypothetical protein